MEIDNSLQKNGTLLIMGNDYNINYLQPLLKEPLKMKDETLLSAIYYGDAMNPTLKNGDHLIFKKRSTLTLDSEIYMLQYGELDNVVTGRISESKLKDHVYISYDNPKIKGGAIKRKYILGVWELISSQRIHKQI